MGHICIAMIRPARCRQEGCTQQFPLFTVRFHEEDHGPYCIRHANALANELDKPYQPREILCLPQVSMPELLL